MTVAAKPSVNWYLGDGVTTSFAAQFRYGSSASIEVKIFAANGTETIVPPGSGFSATAGDTDAGGTVTLTTAPAAGTKLRIRRVTPKAQASTWTTQDRFPAKETENAHDNGMLISQELGDAVDDLNGRAIIAAPGDGGLVLPTKASLLGGSSRLALMVNPATGGLALLDIGAEFKGDPGGNVMAIGLFTAASGLSIPVGTDLVQTSGYSQSGRGAARYGYSATVDAAYVTAHPRSSFMSANGRGFRLCEQHPDLYHYGAVGDGVTLDTAAINAALSDGLVNLFVLPGTYRTAGGHVIGSGSTLERIECQHGSRFLLVAANGAKCLQVQKQLLRVSGFLDLKSTGSKGDGFSTVGLEIGTSLAGQAYCEFERIRGEGFSDAAVATYGPVYTRINRADIYSSGHGISLRKVGSSGATAFVLGPSYITGCTRGVSAIAAAWVAIDATVEYSGTSAGNTATGVGVDGAFHFEQCARVTVYDRYGEGNARNLVLIDSPITFMGGGVFAATVADCIVYSAIPSSQRGVVEIVDNSVRAAFFGPDQITGRDALLGSNAVLPLDGSPMRIGKQTQISASGLATSGAWTKILDIVGQTGDPQARKVYDYSVRVGAADLVPVTTPVDRGTIANGVLVSHLGSVPAWLRLSPTTGNLEIQITSSSYGLTWSVEATVRHGSSFS